MSRYLALFDAAGHLSSLQDAEFIAMLQLMGRSGAVSTSSLAPSDETSGSGCMHGVVPGMQRCAAGLLPPRAARHKRLPLCCAAHAVAPAAHVPVVKRCGCEPGSPASPPARPQVFSPVQKARVAAASHPHFPDVRQGWPGLRLGAGLRCLLCMLACWTGWWLMAAGSLHPWDLNRPSWHHSPRPAFLFHSCRPAGRANRAAAGCWAGGGPAAGARAAGQRQQQRQRQRQQRSGGVTQARRSSISDKAASKPGADAPCAPSKIQPSQPNDRPANPTQSPRPWLLFPSSVQVLLPPITLLPRHPLFGFLLTRPCSNTLLFASVPLVGGEEWAAGGRGRRRRGCRGGPQPCQGCIILPTCNILQRPGRIGTHRYRKADDMGTCCLPPRSRHRLAPSGGAAATPTTVARPALQPIALRASSATLAATQAPAFAPSSACKETNQRRQQGRVNRGQPIDEVEGHCTRSPALPGAAGLRT